MSTDHRVCIVGAGPVGEAVDLARLPLVVGYTKYQESEADEQGVTLALEAGYDPRCPEHAVMLSQCYL